MLVLIFTWVGVRFVKTHRHYGLYTLGNLLKALFEGDYAVRAAIPKGDGEHAKVLAGFNRLARHLQDEQRSQQESLQLLSKTLAALDGAVFVFEQDGRLRMVNPAGERLFGQGANLLGRSASELELEQLFSLPSGSIWTNAFNGRTGRWQVNHAVLRRRSQSGKLLVLQPIERALREQEAEAFRKLLRVLGHEINNSLAPIASMADTLRRIVPKPGVLIEEDLHADMRCALDVIEQRSLSLQKFIGGYAQLARLPPPKGRPFELASLCKNVVRLMGPANVELEQCDEVLVFADPDQVTQVLINLLRNAIDAGGTSSVQMQWRRNHGQAVIQISDSGHGIPSSGNLFVPFFTTKPNGAGIGLALSRQIIEAQGGTIDLANKCDGCGAVATIVLPAV